MLRFDAMATCIAEAGVVLERAAAAGGASEPDLTHLAQALDDLPALAWGETPARESPAPSAGDAVMAGPPQAPVSALVVGREALADALTEEGEATFLECERTEDVPAALGLARALAPDIVLLDADMEGVLELVESLLDDPLTEPVPIIVVGSFRAPEHAARFVALGVAKTLAKPLAPAILRRACQEAIDQREGRTMRLTLGEPTVEQLGDRLADEVRRALVESVDTAARSRRVPLGEGTEVMGAVWGAIARVREVITARTEGAVRYGGHGPEGAFALAPWLHAEVIASDRAVTRGRGAAVDVNLDKRCIIVADDDPGVTWFISDLLRATGCVVHEALDGKTALELARRVSPELVVSDILMPGLDGFALCRAIRRDVALRDVPVILLSWKEDLLQRVRELGASAAAYLRKESDARAIVARVREVLRPRARVEARLRAQGEVRGRLDDVTVRTLLELVCAARPDSRVTVRDASFVYEVDVRDGAPRRATRSAGDGSFQRGERVLAAMLGVGAGRFVVAPAEGAVTGDLRGTLGQQLAPAIARAREAVTATTGARTMNVDRVVLDQEDIAAYLLATPEPARLLVQRLAEGASPRELLLRGDVAPSLLEDVLSDLACRGAITAVRDAQGRDVLKDAIESALASIQSEPAAPQRTPSPMPASELVARELPAFVDASRRARRVSQRTSDAPPSSRRSSTTSDDQAPSSLEDAVMRAMSDRSPPGSAPTSSVQPSIVEPSQLRPRSSNPPAPDAAGSPSLPPDAVVPANSSGDMIAAVPAAVEAPPEAPAPQPPEPSFPIPIHVDSSAPLPSLPRETADPTVPQATFDLRKGDTVKPQAPRRPAPPVVQTTSLVPPGERRGRFILVVVVILIVVLAGIRWSAPQRALSFFGDEKPSANSAHPSGTFGEVPPGFNLPAGDGLLDVTLQENADLIVDGVAMPPPHVDHKLRMSLPAGMHEMRIGKGTHETTRVAEVRAGLATRVDLSDLQ